jgi:hypothetical protein
MPRTDGGQWVYTPRGYAAKHAESGDYAAKHTNSESGDAA